MPLPKPAARSTLRADRALTRRRPALPALPAPDLDSDVARRELEQLLRQAALMRARHAHGA